MQSDNKITSYVNHQFELDYFQPLGVLPHIISNKNIFNHK